MTTNTQPNNPCEPYTSDKLRRVELAAPDLLAACEAIVADAAAGHGTNWLLIDQASKAIRKARGQNG